MNIISRKKPHYKPYKGLMSYLENYNRVLDLPVTYTQLLEYDFANALTDKTGRDTLWESVHYGPDKQPQIHSALKNIYALLKTEGDTSVTEHLEVDRVDYCTFGNSKPFRIRIINRYNDNYDYFYVKQADASRIYGLELEHILSPNRIIYFVDGDTLIEEHIVGIPGDRFVAEYLDQPATNKIRIAKEFVKFNERCFIRLLGDMRSYNYVVDATQDFEATQYRIRAIDFDQQCYEGRKNLYLPQFYKENIAFVNLTLEFLNPKTITQYQSEERALIAKRFKASRNRFERLMQAMETDIISTPEKTIELGKELATHYNDNTFTDAKTMGDLLRMSLHRLEKH
ncbi:MAG: hypothetical protein M0D57_10960 [Sphingobacteriales bacterium JAD_PAG50586_3]|nr:MAG: hypothetical protein M0D57_10960 [Sphingobacteriales bacterium JAD_PAG50586_3]